MPFIEQVYIDTQELESDDVRALRELLKNDQAISNISERIHFEESISGNSWLVGFTIMAAGKAIDFAKERLTHWIASRDRQYEIVTIYDYVGEPALKVKKKLPKPK